jgi:hypothetical protein
MIFPMILRVIARMHSMVMKTMKVVLIMMTPEGEELVVNLVVRGSVLRFEV